MRAVIAPTGISDGAIAVLAMVSANTKNEEPTKKEAGITILLSTPRIILHICGTSKPTKPIIPLTDTNIPTNKLERI